MRIIKYFMYKYVNIYFFENIYSVMIKINYMSNYI